MPPSVSASPRRKRIAVLGGGLGALSAVWHLTQRPDWQQHYEIDVYPLGWRLGGKGASGRNADMADRIEEHGLHMLFGFYDNGLALLRSLYAELGRPPEAPLATFDAAFTGHDLITLTDEYTAPGEDPFWTFRMPAVDSTEGRSLGALLDGRLRDVLGLPPDAAPSTLRGLPALLGGVLGLLRELLSFEDLRAVARSAFHEIRNGTLDLGDLVGAVARFVSHVVGMDMVGENPLGTLLERASDRLTPLLGRALYRDDPRIPDRQEAAAEAVGVALEGVNLLLAVSWQTTRLRRLLMLASLGLSAVRGLLRDLESLWAPDWFSLDDRTLEAWLCHHGCDPRVADSCLTRVLRQVGFAGEQGAGAGTTLHWAMRMVLDYQGRFMYKMNAGMGDVVFVPFYRVLQRRGVRFHFFHRVDAIRHNHQGRIQAVELGRPVQVRAGSDAYDPLVTVKGLECWPDRPRFDQLVEGEALRRRWAEAPLATDLENWWTDWPDALPPRILRDGQDFDHVILGISVAALPEICHDLCHDPRNPAFGEMVRALRTTQTRAIQLWLKTDLHGLGYTAGEALDPNFSPVLGTCPSRLDTWSDTTLVADRESWPPGHVQHIAYWCAGMPDEDAEAPLPPRAPGHYLHRQHLRAFANLVEWAGYHVQPTWPLAAEPPLSTFVHDGIDDEEQMRRGSLFVEAARLSNQIEDHLRPRTLPEQRSLKMDLLALPPNPSPHPVEAVKGTTEEDGALSALASDPALAGLRSQYWRVPHNPSERYVLSVPGSVRKRLAPWASGYANLFLAGDWTLSPISAGCVEATVQSGAMCSQALIGAPSQIANNWLPMRPPPPALWLPPLPGEEPPLIPPLVDPLPAPPYRANQTRLQAFLVRADLAVLEGICTRMLGLGAPRLAFRPVGPFVLFVAADIHRFDTAQPQASTPERDFGFWIPIYQGHLDEEGTFLAERFAFFLPALWVEPALAITAGREIFGYQKSEGRLAAPRSPEDPQHWTIEGLVVPRFGPPHLPSSAYRWAPIAQIQQDTPPLPLFSSAEAQEDDEDQEKGRGGWSFEGLLRRIGSRLEGKPLQQEADAAFLRTLLGELRGMQIPMVYLKQIPSISDPQRACYQAICRSQNTVLGDFTMHILPGTHTLTLHRHDSCDLATALGISVDAAGRAPIVIAFHMAFDFQVALGEVLHDVRRPG